MSDIYQTGEYRDNNPSWHERDAPWKAKQIHRILSDNAISFDTLCEIGCGTGEILVQLARFYPSATFTGWDISPHALELSRDRESDRISFHLGDSSAAARRKHDVVLVADVVEHVHDCFEFVQSTKHVGKIGVFHIPLDMSVQSVLRSWPMLNLRKTVGHVHYFSKDTALALLMDCSYRVIDWQYTASRLDLGDQARSSRLIAPIRRLFFRLSPDLAVRILGGYSLLVLAE